MNSRVVRMIAGTGAVVFGSHAVPHFDHLSDCAQVGMVICDEEPYTITPGYAHAPHGEFGTENSNPWEIIASGQSIASSVAANSPVLRYVPLGKPVLL